MKHIKLSAAVSATLIGGFCLFRQTLRGGPLLHPLPLVAMGAGFVLAGTALSVQVVLCEGSHWVSRRTARRTLIGGLSLGATLALLGLIAALTTLLSA